MTREYSPTPTPAPQPFFLETPNQPPLFCVWRAPQQTFDAPQAELKSRVWILVPPFFEEEKSARRTLSEFARRLQKRGEYSLFVTPRGLGDSGGELENISLLDWQADLARARDEAQERLPNAELVLCGVRLGAALCALFASQSGAEKLLLLEPVVSGRVLVRDLLGRKTLRAAITREESGASKNENAPENASRVLAEIEDIDGWALSKRLRDELAALDLFQVEVPTASVRLVQISGRSELSAPLQKLAAHWNASTRVLTARPFWTQNGEAHDESVFSALLE